MPLPASIQFAHSRVLVRCSIRLLVSSPPPVTFVSAPLREACEACEALELKLGITGLGGYPPPVHYTVDFLENSITGFTGFTLPFGG